MHRKILVVDETIGFIGGVNIRHDMRKWLDIHVRVEGNIVHALLRSFAKSYVMSGGNRSTVRHLLRPPAHADIPFVPDDMELIVSSPHPSRSRIRKRYTDALLRAREHVILFSPYYIPDRHFIRALWSARKRGVRVDMLLPLRTDVRLATYAAYGYFALMKKMGVNVRLMKQMMHGKGVIIDNEEAIVGSGNLDSSSFYDNYEANIHIRDKRLVQKLRQTLDGWSEMASSLEELLWDRLGLWERVKIQVTMHLAKLWYPRAQ